MTLFKLVAFTSFLVVALIGSFGQNSPAAPQQAADAEQPPKWVKALPATACNSASLGTYCHQSSPAVADIDQDGRDDIIVATNNGHVLALSGEGKILWDRDVAPLFGLSGGQQTIVSSPAVADIDADGHLEIVVGTGYEANTCRPGGVVILDRDGRALNGWPIQTKDNNVPPGNCADPVFGTPALGDLDNDGDLEIVVGSFDHRIYAWHHSGRLLDGFPAKSALFVTMGWENMRSQLGDTIWSSPALADLDDDGYLDIIIGTDEGMVDSSFGDTGWNCPYAAPDGATDGYCGGTLYAYDRNGEFLPGYPKHILETIQSSPAIADVNQDGFAEVFVGTGSFYLNNSPDKPTYGQSLFGWSHTGEALAGWDGGRPTQSVLPASPAIGNIAGDAAPEIIVSGLAGRLYAWHHDGTVVSGFPMTPRNFMGSSSPQDVGKSLVLGDYDGDGKMEIFLTLGWSVGIIDGDGRMLTNSNASADNSTPFYVTKGLIQNNAALGDVDGDGVLELIAQNSELTVWDLPSGAKTADWPVFRRDAARSGSALRPHLKVDPPEIVLGAAAGEDRLLPLDINISLTGSAFRWDAQVVSGDGVRLVKNSGSGQGTATVSLEAEWPASLEPGDYLLGVVEIRASNSDLDSDSPTRTVPVRLKLIRKTAAVYLPSVPGAP